MIELKPGDNAPDFELLTDEGKTFRLSDARGKTVILFFYPQDDTPGCATECTQFRDHHTALADRGALIVGASPDGSRSHRRFREKYDLPFVLLCDEKHELAERYGAWVKKDHFEREHYGIERSTFVIDADGRIKCAYRKVRPDGHAEEILRLLGG